MKLKLIVPAGLLVLGGLAACSSDPATPATQPAGNQQQAADTSTETNEQPAQEEEAAEGGKPKEEPLTGKLKQKAEKAALAEFPGTVKKSEHDAENPGMYAVEIEQDAGGEIEVYLDKQFNVVKTKKEDGGNDGTEDGD